MTGRLSNHNKETRSPAGGSSFLPVVATGGVEGKRGTMSNATIAETDIITRLREEKAEYEVSKSYYSKRALPEFLVLNKEWRSAHPDKFAYNSDLEEYAMQKLNLPEELRDITKTQVYLSQRDFHNEEKEAYKTKMLAEGWRELNEDVCREAIKQNKRLQVSARGTVDWLSFSQDGLYRVREIQYDGNPLILLMKPKAKTRGIPLFRFENGFCKIVQESK